MPELENSKQQRRKLWVTAELQRPLEPRSRSGGRGTDAGSQGLSPLPAVLWPQRLSPGPWPSSGPQQQNQPSTGWGPNNVFLLFFPVLAGFKLLALHRGIEPIPPPPPCALVPRERGPGRAWRVLLLLLEAGHSHAFITESFSFVLRDGEAPFRTGKALG